MTAQQDISDAIIRNRHSSGIDRFVSKEARDKYNAQKHSGKCAVIMGYQFCTCGIDGALAEADKP